MTKKLVQLKYMIEAQENKIGFLIERLLNGTLQHCFTKKQAIEMFHSELDYLNLMRREYVELEQSLSGILFTKL